MSRNQDSPRTESSGLPLGAKRPGLWALAAAVLVAVGVFGPVLGSDLFIVAPKPILRVDIPKSVLRMPQLSHHRHVPAIFGQDFMAFTDARYRPLSYSLLALVRTVVPADSFIFWRLFLLAFHVLNALLAYAVARHFARRGVAALVCLAVFLLHPMASDFAGRINLFHSVLGGSFYFAGFLCYLRYVRTRRAAVYVAGVICFLLGLLTSSVVLTLPILILLYEIFHERARVSSIVRRLLPFAACVLLMTPCYLMFRAHPIFYTPSPKCEIGTLRYWSFTLAAGGVDSLLGLARGWHTRVPVSGIVRELGGTWRLVCASAVVLVWLVATFWAMRRRGWAAVGLFLLFVGGFPRFTSFLSPLADYASWDDRYLPLAGFALLAGSATDTLLSFGSDTWRKCVAAGGTVLAVFYGVLLVVANVHGRTPDGYWRYALKRNPQSEAAALGLGKACLAEGREAEAIRYMFSARATTVRDGCIAMARYYSRRGQSMAAVAHRLMASREPSYGLRFQEDALCKAEILHRARAFDPTEHVLAHVLMANPYCTEAYRRLAEVQVAKGYLPAAVLSLRKAVDINPGDAESATRLAELEHRLFYPEEHETPEEIKPPDPDWLRFAADQGRTEKMRRALVLLGERCPEDPVIQLLAAVALSEGGRHKAALERIDRVLEALSSYSFAWATRFWAAANAGDRHRALDTLRHMPRLAPVDAEMWFKLGHQQTSAKRPELAIACYETAMKADPTKVDIHLNLGVIHARRRDYHNALKYFRSALELATEGRERVHGNLGFVLMKLDRRDEAIAEYGKSLAIDPRQPRIRHKVVGLLDEEGRFAESIRILSEGLELNPGNLVLSADLARLLATAPDADLRDGERAVRLAETVCSNVRPPNARYLDTLAAAYAETGDFKRAVAAAERAATLARSQDNPGLARAIEGRRRLYRMRKPYHFRPVSTGPR